MAAGTRPETKTLDRVCALAAGLAGIGAGRVAKGYRRWSESEHFEQQVRGLTAETQGWFWAALRRVSREGRTDHHAVEIIAELAVCVPPNASSDLNAAWDFALALRDALENPANYGAGEFAPRVSVEFRGVDTLGQGGVAIFDFGAHGTGEVVAPAP